MIILFQYLYFNKEKSTKLSLAIQSKLLISLKKTNMKSKILKITKKIFPVINSKSKKTFSLP